MAYKYVQKIKYYVSFFNDTNEKCLFLIFIVY